MTTFMTERKLLEDAAKAAGLILIQVPNAAQTDADWWAYAQGAAPNTAKPWNPLTDDGDALRLAVKVGLTVDSADGTPDGNKDTPATRIDAPDGRMLLIEAHGSDPYAATRRAIVRAAASLFGTTKE